MKYRKFHIFINSDYDTKESASISNLTNECSDDS
jgi:hypothetical protein